MLAILAAVLVAQVGLELASHDRHAHPDAGRMRIG
jgi:hypothetical protein